ncbi:interferon gamma receptor 1 [Ctenodactylus gundi]
MPAVQEELALDVFKQSHEDELGPPTVAATQKKDHVIIDVFHPLVIVNGKKLGTVYNAETDCHTIEYTVNVKVNGSEIPETKYKLKDDNCTETLCQLSIPASPLNSQYCVSAEGVSSAWGVKTNKSRELCFTISSSSQKGSIWIPIVAVFLVSLVFILIFVYCHLKKNSCKRKSIKLPKSLVSVVKCATSETKPESKYVSVITACEPFVLENEVLICEEPLSPAPVPSTDIQDNTGKVEGEEPLSTEIEVIPNESISDLAPGSPLTLRENSLHSSSNQSESCDITLNSYHTKNGSDSGLVGLDSFVSDSEILPSNKTEMNTGGQESATLRNAPTSFGYDKPHVMVDLLVGDDVKESLIGYRLTTDSSEFS